MTYGKFFPCYGVSHTPFTIIYDEFFSKYDEREKSRSSKTKNSFTFFSKKAFNTQLKICAEHDEKTQ